jgi:hypothetical protein
MSVLVLWYVMTSGLSLSTLAGANYRNEHLAGIGFHSNELGTLLAIAYALLIAARTQFRTPRARAASLLLLVRSRRRCCSRSPAARCSPSSW